MFRRKSIQAMVVMAAWAAALSGASLAQASTTPPAARHAHATSAARHTARALLPSGHTPASHPRAAAAASASAATQPAPRTKAQWQAGIAHVRQPGTGCYRASYPVLHWRAAKCVTAPRIPLVPRPLRRPARHAGPTLVGNGTDYSAQVSGTISQATGTFQDVSSGITEQGYVDGTGSLTDNAFSLQLNSQFFAGSSACSGASKPSSCQAWQQFVYTYEGSTDSYLFMQYWLINYGTTCPSGWNSYGSDCYANSNAAQVSAVTASQLATVQLSGSAASGGNDGVSLAVGSGQATSVTNLDSTVGLAAHWNTTEWGVYGDGGGSEAVFGSGATLQAQTALTATSSAAPSCIAEGFTGETNNLNLTSTPALGSESSPTMASRQTDGTTGTASCSVATSPPPGSLQAGQVLRAGQTMVSGGGQYTLAMQTDGNLVVYGNDCVIWASNTAGTGSANYLAMQTDGNLVIYTSAGKPVWASNTAGTGSANYLAMQGDGNLVVYTNAGKSVWGAGRNNADQLCTNGVLHACQYLYSPSEQYRVIMQTDGNLVIYTSAGKALWASNTAGTGSANYLAMQGDGNLVVYTSAGKPVWASNTVGSGSANHLDMQNDGNLVVYTGAGKAAWASGTWQLTAGPR